MSVQPSACRPMNSVYSPGATLFPPITIVQRSFLKPKHRDLLAVDVDAERLLDRLRLRTRDR